MGKKVLMQGNEACVMGAIAAGMRFFAGYPITPSTEIAEISAQELPKVGGRFLQMEDEISGAAAAIGASVAGVKAMTATSGPGFSLKQEHIGYAAEAEIPVVVVDVQRVGPSTGLPTSPAQGDLMQARWGTHGDHPAIVISPATVRETYLEAIRCFNLAEKYRTPVIFLMDEMVGHLREGIELPESDELEIVDRPINWDLTDEQAYAIPEGKWVPEMAPFGEGQHYNVSGLFHDETGFPRGTAQSYEKFMTRLLDKVEKNRDDIEKWEEKFMDDAEIAVVSFGGAARSAEEAVLEARKQGIKAGLFRPITVWPFPEKALEAVAQKVKRIIVVENNAGQMVIEVKAHAGNTPVDFLGRFNGSVVDPDEVLAKLQEEA